MPLPRLAPEIDLPPYAFVPGRHPHPVRDPAGHSYGRSSDLYGQPPPLEGWEMNRALRHVLDLFNFGYYWEAHEGLEHWWKQLPETDARRAFFQGLLHLAAAGVKARQGHAAGIHSHATKAGVRLREAALRTGQRAPRLYELDVASLADTADRLALRAHTFRAQQPLPDVEPVLGLKIVPSSLAGDVRR